MAPMGPTVALPRVVSPAFHHVATVMCTQALALCAGWVYGVPPPLAAKVFACMLHVAGLEPIDEGAG